MRLLALALALASGAAAQTYDLAARITLDDQSRDDFLGWAVAIDGDRALVGAPQTAIADAPGAVYVYERGGDGTWAPTDTLVSGIENVARDRFGYAIGLDGDVAVVGAAPVDAGGTATGGAALVFERTTDGWAQTASLPAPAASPDVRSVAASGSRVAVGAGGGGTVAVYARDGAGDWVLDGTLSAESGGSAVALTGDVALDGETVVAVGSFRPFVFERSGTGWAQVAELVSDPVGLADAVDLDGERLIVGSPLTEAAFVFTRSAGGWAQSAVLEPTGTDGNDPDVGAAVAVSAGTAVVGAPGDGPGGADRGAAFVFTEAGGTWTQVAKLLPAGSFGPDAFGFSVDTDGGRVAAGAFRGSSATAGTGAAYVFEAAGQTSAEGAPDGVLRLGVGPNPASGRVRVAVATEAAGPARLAVYDVLGREVAVLHDGPLAAGGHAFALDAARLGAGAYVVRLTAENGAVARRLTVVR